MNARILNIKSKNRRNPVGVANPADFHFSEGNSIDAQVMIKNPNISLYCLDHNNDRALFVETPAGIDLSQAPFYYQAQYENAISLFGVPYLELHRLANNMRIDGSRLILIYSVGRTGSTMLSSAFNQIENIVGLSEPDIYTQLVAIRKWDKSNDNEVGELLQSCTKVLCKTPLRNRLPLMRAFKFRSFGIEIADLMFKRFPEAKIIFLYRDALTWTRSAIRAFINDDFNSVENLKAIQAMLRPLAHLIDKHISETDAPLSMAKIAAFMWLSVMERYMELYRQGVPMFAVRYQDLTAFPKQAIKAIFKYCDAPTNGLEKIFGILDQDSQAGSKLSRTNLKEKTTELPDNFQAEIEQYLREHPTVKTPFFIAPNTWSPNVGE